MKKLLTWLCIAMFFFLLGVVGRMEVVDEPGYEESR